jgi:hypothetical protein
MKDKPKIALCSVVFVAFLVFQFGDFHLHGLALIGRAFLDIAGAFAGFWLVVMLLGNNPKSRG